MLPGESNQSGFFRKQNGYECDGAHDELLGLEDDIGDLKEVFCDGCGCCFRYLLAYKCVIIMSHQVLGFQLFNLNDYGIKLFPAFKVDTLYLAKFEIVEKQFDQHDLDEGSSQRHDKLLLVPSKNNEVHKSFPFTGLFRDELVQVKTTKQQIDNAVTLFNVEYNYILILYFSSQDSANKISKYFTELKMETQETETLAKFIQQKEDELDEKIYKESSGNDRLQKKVNPVHSKEVPSLANHVIFLEDDDTFKDQYIHLIKQFDREFIHSESKDFEYDSTAQKNTV